VLKSVESGQRAAIGLTAERLPYELDQLFTLALIGRVDPGGQATAIRQRASRSALAGRPQPIAQRMSQPPCVLMVHASTVRLSSSSRGEYVTG
jgi:hypothetical protein